MAVCLTDEQHWQQQQAAAAARAGAFSVWHRSCSSNMWSDWHDPHHGLSGCPILTQAAQLCCQPWQLCVQRRSLSGLGPVQAGQLQGRSAGSGCRGIKLLAPQEAGVCALSPRNVVRDCLHGVVVVPAVLAEPCCHISSGCPTHARACRAPPVGFFCRELGAYRCVTVAVVGPCPLSCLRST